jgi:hypothetical protein
VVSKVTEFSLDPPIAGRLKLQSVSEGKEYLFVVVLAEDFRRSADLQATISLSLLSDSEGWLGRSFTIPIHTISTN